MQLSPGDQPRGDNDLQPSSDVQNDWEDLSDAGEGSQREPEVMTSSASSSQTASTVLQRKKRRVQTKTATLASPTTPRSRSVKGRRKTPIVEKEKLQEALADGARFTASYAFDVVKGSIEKMKKPLSWFLFIWMFAWLVSRMAPTIRMALSPLCIIPGISKSMLCVPIPIPPTPLVNFERLANIQGSAFDQLAKESMGSSHLSVGVLRAEMATQDLASLVRYSDLKSKDDIADMLHMIAMDAKKTSRGLSRLNARVIGAIDEVMALNNYAMVTIEGAREKAPSRLLRAISPIKLGPTAEEIIAEAFTLAMDESEQAMQKLILEAEVSSQNLEQLDADLGTLHEIITREGRHTTVERKKLLGELWMNFSGKKKISQDYDDRLELLNSLGEHKEQAAAHVKAALRALYTMSDDLEVLRERVAAPGLLESKLPLRVHIENIRKGLERLREGRMAWRGRGTSDEMVRMMLHGGSE